MEGLLLRLKRGNHFGLLVAVGLEERRRSFSALAFIAKESSSFPIVAELRLVAMLLMLQCQVQWDTEGEGALALGLFFNTRSTGGTVECSCWCRLANVPLDVIKHNPKL